MNRRGRPAHSPGVPEGAAGEGKGRSYVTRGRLGFLSVSEGGAALTIMVGPLRGPEHLALVHREQYYHVPVSAIASSRLAVSYIAFYEGASRFGTQIGTVREYAPVLRVSQVRRCDLPGLSWPPRGLPDAPYYRFDLGPIQTLAQPITNLGRLRVGFRFPDYARFREAVSLAELSTEQSRATRSSGTRATSGRGDA